MVSLGWYFFGALSAFISGWFFRGMWDALNEVERRLNEADKDDNGGTPNT